MSSTLAAGTAERDRGPDRYQRHRPEQTLLYRIVDEYYPQFVDLMARQGRPLPDYVQREFEDYLRCGRCGARLSAGTLRHLPRRASAGVQLQTPWICEANEYAKYKEFYLTDITTLWIVGSLPPSPALRILFSL